MTKGHTSLSTTTVDDVRFTQAEAHLGWQLKDCRFKAYKERFVNFNRDLERGIQGLGLFIHIQLYRIDVSGQIFLNID